MVAIAAIANVLPGLAVCMAPLLPLLLLSSVIAEPIVIGGVEFSTEDDIETGPGIAEKHRKAICNSFRWVDQ